MKLEQSAKPVAEAVGKTHGNIRKVIRELRKKLLVTTTGHRGGAADDVVPLDLSRTLTAAMATESPSKAAQAVEDFGSLVCVGNGKEKADGALGIRLDHLGVGHSFEDAVAWLIDLFGTGEFRKYQNHDVAVKLNRNGFTASIETASTICTYVPKWQITPGASFRRGQLTADQTESLAKLTRYRERLNVEVTADGGVLLDLSKALAKAPKDGDHVA